MNIKNNYPDPTEAALRLKAIIETATDGIITISELGIMELVNPAAARLFGYHLEEMIGQKIDLLMPPPHNKLHDSYMQNYLQTGIARIIGIGREVIGLKKDGTQFPCRLSISEVQLKGRRIFTGIVHDLSHQKAAQNHINNLNTELEERVKQRTEELANANESLKNSNQQLEHEIKEREAMQIKLKEALEKEKQLNELKTRFVTTASHEFRTPLSTILSSADIIEAYTDKEQQAKREKHLNKIKSAITNLTNILDDFLSIQKMEEGHLKPHPTLFNLRIFCETLKEEAVPLLKSGQQFRHQGVEEDIMVFLDEQFLKNIFLNLLSNAIKYSDEGQPIDCRVEASDLLIKIEITDCGIGIPELEQQHLFTRFFRAYNVENIQGTGLGLNIVRRYVEIMNGNINFESQLGKGSTFRVNIPIVNTSELKK